VRVDGFVTRRANFSSGRAAAASSRPGWFRFGSRRGIPALPPWRGAGSQCSCRRQNRRTASTGAASWSTCAVRPSTVYAWRLVNRRPLFQDSGDECLLGVEHCTRCEHSARGSENGKISGIGRTASTHETYDQDGEADQDRRDAADDRPFFKCGHRRDSHVKRRIDIRVQRIEHRISSDVAGARCPRGRRAGTD
jgi:hypothetical protein